MDRDKSQRTRDIIYSTFAAEGRAPSVAELARLTDLDADSVLENLRDLAAAHALVLSPDGDAIRMAHPFSAAPMAFVVTPDDGRDDRRWWGGCAWDSFGLSAALQLDVRIDTSCPHCGAPIALRSGAQLLPESHLAVRFPRPAATWWDDVVATCTEIRMFCRREHAESWELQHGVSGGYVTDAITVWRLARGWYGDRLAPDFTPHSREHNQRLLDTAGLTGPFWQLPE